MTPFDPARVRRTQTHDAMAEKRAAQRARTPSTKAETTPHPARRMVPRVDARLHTAQPNPTQLRPSPSRSTHLSTLPALEPHLLAPASLVVAQRRCLPNRTHPYRRSLTRNPLGGAARSRGTTTTAHTTVVTIGYLAPQAPLARFRGVRRKRALPTTCRQNPSAHRVHLKRASPNLSSRLDPHRRSPSRAPRSVLAQADRLGQRRSPTGGRVAAWTHTLSTISPPLRLCGAVGDAHGRRTSARP